MEITIGMKNMARDLVIDVEKDIGDAVTRALAGDDKVLDITDGKGNRYLLAAASITYVQIGTDEHRFVGFGA